MSGFLLGAFAMMALTVGVLMSALRKPVARGDDAERRAQNIRIARARLDELGEHADDVEARGAIESEIELALMDDIEADATQPPKRAARINVRYALLTVLTLIAAATVLLYLQLGAPSMLFTQGDRSATQVHVNQLLQRLEKKLADEPEVAAHWQFAAWTYLQLQRWDEAQHAYQNLVRLLEEESGDKADDDSGDLSNAASTNESANLKLRVRVEIAPQLATQLRGDEEVHIVAAAAQGAPLPLATAQVRARELPATIAADDWQAMAARLTLTAFAQIALTARIVRADGGALGGATVIADPKQDAQTVVLIDRAAGE